jgi:hypothetical protein
MDKGGAIGLPLAHGQGMVVSESGLGLSSWAKRCRREVVSYLAGRGRPGRTVASTAGTGDGSMDFCLSARMEAEDVEQGLNAVKKDIADVEDRLRKLAERYPG